MTPKARQDLGFRGMALRPKGLKVKAAASLQHITLRVVSLLSIFF